MIYDTLNRLAVLKVEAETLGVFRARFDTVIDTSSINY